MDNISIKNNPIIEYNFLTTNSWKLGVKADNLRKAIMIARKKAKTWTSKERKEYGQVHLDYYQFCRKNDFYFGDMKTSKQYYNQLA